MKNERAESVSGEPPEKKWWNGGPLPMVVDPQAMSEEYARALYKEPPEPPSAELIHEAELYAPLPAADPVIKKEPMPALKYPCGCTVTGPAPLPAYCPEHGSRPSVPAPNAEVVFERSDCRCDCNPYCDCPCHTTVDLQQEAEKIALESRIWFATNIRVCVVPEILSKTIDGSEFWRPTTWPDVLAAFAAHLRGK